MAPRQYSRFVFSQAVRLSSQNEETLWLADREPFPFQQRNDNIFHVVGENDTLFSLAGKYFRGYPRAAGFWWVIADYQPQRIHDPTLQLAPGAILVIPSRRMLEESIFSQERRKTG